MEITKISIKVMEQSPKETQSKSTEKNNDKDFNKLIIKETAKQKNSEESKDSTQDVKPKEEIKVSTKGEKPTEGIKVSTEGEKPTERIKVSTEDEKPIEEIKTEEPAEVSELLSLLYQLTNSIKSTTDKTSNKEEILTSLKSKISSKDFTKVMTLIEQLVNSETTPNTEVPKAQFNSILSDIKQELSKLIKGPDTKEDGVKSILPGLKEVMFAKVENQENTKGNTKDNNGKKEENFLENLTTEGKTDKNTKVISLMNQFTIAKNQEVKDVKEPNPINKNNLVNDVVKTLKYMETNELKNLTVKITPKELGEITVKLTMEAGVMKATITAANKDTYNLLQGNLQDMNSRLINNEVKISNISLSLYNEDTTFYSGNSGQNNFNQGNNKKEQGISRTLLEEEKELNYNLEGNVNKFA